MPAKGDQIIPFVRQLRWALHHLYDPGELARSPLMQLFGLEPRQGATALRHILLEGIEALRPRPGTPAEAGGWRTYRALYHRYAEQFTPQQVARALGLSERQLRRQQSVALRALAEHLLARSRLRSEGDSSRMSPSERDGEAPAPTREQELEYLERSLPSEAVAAEAVIQSALRTALPLQQALDVQVDCALPAALPRLAGQGPTLRQALLNTLTAAMRVVPGGKVRIRAEVCGGELRIDLQPVGRGLAGQGAQRCSESLEMARQLVSLSGGSLQVTDVGDGPFRACLVLPTAEQVAVLVIDDNADTLQLFQRYLAGTRFPFIGTRDPEHALAIAQEVRPQIVVLDVMLPGVDGWELLGRLRENPASRHIPVIVCTILAEEELALALGAAAFLRKPVSRADFVAALDRQARLLAPSPSG
ncbi:MAG: response regulator [Anaerolineae bacterium]|nr:response regulator [Anaerolineae bacterium]